MRAASMTWSAGGDRLGRERAAWRQRWAREARDAGSAMSLTWLYSSLNIARILNVLVQMFVMLSVATSGVQARERVLFVASIPGMDGWCGDRAVVFDNYHDLIWLNVFDKRKINLQTGRSFARLIACSPDSRWAIVQHGGMQHEGGDPACDPPDRIQVPRVMLWDTERKKTYAIGNGFFGFAWSADGKTLLYRPWPLCDLERDPRTRLRWPVEIREFRPIPLRALINQALEGVPGWIDNGRVGAVGWVDTEKFVVQIPEKEGNAITDFTPYGAILLMHLSDGRVTRAEQLHPEGFNFASGARFITTLKLDIPQLTAKSSNDIVGAAGCETTDTGMGCEREDSAGVENFRPHLERYCVNLTAESARFCQPTATKESWQRVRRGATVLLLKPAAKAKPASGAMSSRVELFRVENDEGGYLQ
jgi:hypothetical protein